MDRLLQAIEDKFNCPPSESLVVNNLNFVLTLLVLLDNLAKIRDLYNMTEFRCLYLIDLIERQIRQVFVTLYMPVEIRAQVK